MDKPGIVGTKLKQIKMPWKDVWRAVQRISMVLLGSVIAALGYSVFQVPFNIAAGGVTGLGILINFFTGVPVGLLYLIMNIPLLILGFYTLGRWRFLIYTLTAVVGFSVAADMFTAYLPAVQDPLTDDMLLSAVYAGLVVGLGNGIIFRAGGTMGGTNIIGRIIQRRTGIPLSQMYLYTDSAVIVVAALLFGWNLALHAILTLFLSGIATDFAMEGPSTVRTTTIVTNKPDELTNALMVGLNQGASHWHITGSYTGQDRSMVLCTVYRSQVNDLKYIVATVDPNAFVVVGNAHQALGGGFHRLKP